MEIFYKPYDEYYSVVFNPNESYLRCGGFSITVNGKLLVSGKAFKNACDALKYPIGIIVKKDDKVICTVASYSNNEQETIMPGEIKIVDCSKWAFISVSVSSVDDVGDNK